MLGRPPANPGFCSGTRLPDLVIALADRTSRSSSWTVIHADRRCGFLYGVFDPQGIAAVEGCDYGQPPGWGGDPHLGDAFLLGLAGPDHHVIQRLTLKLGFDGGTVAEDPRTGTVLISEDQAANDGVHPTAAARRAVGSREPPIDVRRDRGGSPSRSPMDDRAVDR